MLENPTDSSSTINVTTIKRYAPPNQRGHLHMCRNRSHGRRKSGGDRFERVNTIYMNEGEKNQVPTSRNVPTVGHGAAGTGSNSIVNENPPPRLIPLQGCCKSDAFQLMNDRWTAAINSFNNQSIELAEKPTMYSGSSASAWVQFRLPHQLFPSAASVGPSPGLQMDFLNELRRAMQVPTSTNQKS